MGTHPIFESDFDCLTEMTLESTVICVDNSEYCRNGDYAPTRLLAQRDAINMVTRSKLKQNAEYTCALFTMANNGLAATLTSDSAKLHSVLSRVEPGGEIKFGSAVRIAQLSLKHRMNKHHKQRIIMFICSPIADEERDVVKIAKKLKKEKVNIDIISFGEYESNNEKLATFINTLSGADGSSSHLVSIPANTSLSDALRKSPIIDDGSSGGGGGAGFGGGFEIDEAADPELAMALRISLEEQRARQQQTGGETQETKKDNSNEQQAMDQDQQMLQDALLLSMGGGGAPAAAAPEAAMEEDGGNLAAMTEEEQIALAIQMSMAESAAPEEETADAPMEEATDSQLVTDPAFLQSVLRNLPGVDPDSEAVQEALGKKDE